MFAFCSKTDVREKWDNVSHTKNDVKYLRDKQLGLFLSTSARHAANRQRDRFFHTLQALGVTRQFETTA